MGDGGWSGESPVEETEGLAGFLDGRKVGGVPGHEGQPRSECSGRDEGVCEVQGFASCDSAANDLNGNDEIFGFRNDGLVILLPFIETGESRLSPNLSEATDYFVDGHTGDGHFFE